MDNKDLMKCKELRKRIFLTAYGGGMAHLASSFSCLEILYTLYLKGIMKYDAGNPDLPDRDRLVLSKGHAGLALYSVMCEAGFLEEKELETFLKPGTHIGGEPCMRDLKGVEASTGSLGHGLSVGAGMAMAQKMDGLKARTYVILGDGECEEGTVWEGALSAAAFGLDNLVAVLDCNRIQKMCTVEETIKLANWKEKWESFGWEVQEVNGHDTDELQKCFQQENGTGKPLFVIAHTVKGKGVSVMEDNPVWHFKLPNRKEMKYFMQELEITEEELERGRQDAERIHK